MAKTIFFNKFFIYFFIVFFSFSFINKTFTMHDNLQQKTIKDPTPLIDAVKEGNLKSVIELIKNGADTNLTDKYGFPPIFYAYENANFDIVAELKNAGAQGDINIQIGPNRSTPLIYAIIGNDLKAVKKLIANGANTNLATSNGCFPIFYAYSKANFDMVTELKNAGAQGNINIQAGPNLTTPLIDAILGNNLETVKQLIANGADTNLADKSGSTPIFYAYRKANFEIVAELKNTGAQGNINMQVAEYLTTPLIEAIIENNLDAVKKLIENGADTNLADKNGHTPIFYAYSKANFDIAAELEKAGAQGNINMQVAEHLKTPLSYAVLDNNLEAVKKLIANGANTNLANKNGYTPIFDAYCNANFDIVTELKNAGAQGNVNMKTGPYLISPLIEAIAENNLKAVKKLIENGADTNLADKNGCPPIFYAYFNANFVILTELKNTGAQGDINIQGKTHKATPLIFAIQNNNLEAVKKLILAGADINMANKQNQTPLHIACQENNIQIVRLLLEQNTNIDDNLYQTVRNIEILKYLNLRKDFTLAGDKIEFILSKKENLEDLNFLIRYTFLDELKKLNLEATNNKNVSFFDNLFARIYALGLHEIAFTEEITKQKSESKIWLKAGLKIGLYELANIIAKENNIKLKNALSLESEENKMKKNIINKERNDKLCDLIVRTDF